MTEMTQQQLLWRCRRGVRELDVILTRFVDESYSDLSDEQRTAFHNLLAEQDPIIMDWLFGKSQSSDDGMMQIIARLRGQSGLGSI